MSFCLRTFKLISFLYIGCFISSIEMSAAGINGGTQDYPVTKEAKDLLRKYGCKYIFKIKTQPPVLKKGAFSGAAVKNLSVPISLKLSFKDLGENYYRNIDLDRAKLFKQDKSGKLIPVEFWFKPSTQHSGILKWSSMTKDSASYLFCVPPKNSKNIAKPSSNVPLFMDGGALSKPGEHNVGGLYYINYFDVNNDGKKDIVTGAYHDYVRVFENIAESPDDIPLVSDNHSYNLADENDLPLAHDYFSHGWQLTAPVFYDFNNDGKNDVLMGGSHTSKKVRYWENIGTADTPVYGKRRMINLVCEDGYKHGGLYPVPCDFNGDGKLDLIAGTMFGGNSKNRYIYFFEGLSKKASDFKFKPGVRLKDKNGVINVPGYSNCSVEVFDWNNDGLPDLFAASDNNLFYWENKGSRTRPVLVKTSFPKLKTSGRVSMKIIPGKKSNDIITGSNLIYHENNGKSFTSTAIKSISPSPISFGGHSTIKVTDWNGDGRKDIITSTDWGNLSFAVNNNGKWDERILLKSNGKEIKLFGCVDPGEHNKGYARMALADLDGDGNLDLLVNHERSWRFGYLAFYKNLGNGEFAAEIPLDIPRMSHLNYKKGIKGKAAVFDKDTILDYFSYPADKIFTPAGGEVSLYFSPAQNSPFKESMTLLHNQAFNCGNTKIGYGDEFKITIEKDGAVSWKNGKSKLHSSVLKWQKDKWYKLTFKWGRQGMSAALDDKEIVKSPDKEFPKKAGPRLYVGTQQSISFIQKSREYPQRLHYHKDEYSKFFPADGLIDELKIKDQNGNDTFYLSFDGTTDGFAPESKKKIPGGMANIAYRAAPAAADLDGDSLPDLILPICPNPNKRDGDPVTLYWFRNDGTKTQPHFLSGRSLGVNAGVRSSMRFVDFDDDGDLDLLIMKFGGELHYYVNTGTAQKPSLKHKGRLVGGAWGHESGVDVADWNNDGNLDIIVTNGDNGSVLVYDKQFIDELVPRCEVEEIITSAKILKKTHAEKRVPVKVKKVYSDKKNDHKASNVCNNIKEGASEIGWWGKHFPRQLTFEFEKQTKINQVDCYWGHPTHALNNAGGSRDPKSFLFEYWDGSNWKALFPKVERSERKNNLGLGKTASFSFPTQKTNKVRLTFYSSYDTGKSAKTKKTTPEKYRAVFVREIDFYGEQ